MIEYLYNAIRAVTGQAISINAKITNDDGSAITDGCCLVIHTDNKEIRVDGTYLNDLEMWEFNIPAEATKGLQGRYWYCMQHNNANVCFKQPIYFVG